MNRLVVIAATLAALLLALPSAASAGTYDVVACDAAPSFANNSWRQEVSHSSMVTFTACPSSDNPKLGLGARNGYFASGTTAPTGAAARWWFDAPPGTAIVGIRANGLFEQKSHRWQTALSNGAQLFAGCPATPSNTGAFCADGMNAADYVALPGSGALYTEVYCAYGPCPVERDWWAWASLTWVSVTVLDQTAPSVGNPGGSLWSDGWVSGTRQATFDASDNTGIKDVRVLIAGREMARAGRGCDPTAKTCPNWPGVVLDVATHNGIPDGEHELVLDAVDRGDNHGSVSRKVRIDNTAPAAPRDLAVQGGEGWHAANDFNISWTNPEPQAAPIAGADYRLCPVPDDDCVSGTVAGRDLTELKNLEVPHPGEWTLTVWLRDEAGNARPETAAAPVHLRLDAEPPVLAIREHDPEDPARVRVEARDAVSGIARGEVEVKRDGTDTWRSVPAQIEDGGFSAMLDDEHLRDGVYEVRARAWDAAGNERSSGRRVSGEVAKVSLPVRVKTKMRVGKKRTVRARGANRRKRVVYVRRPLVGQGKKVRVRGRLTAPGGNPLADVTIDVAARLPLPGLGFQPVATLRTSRTGRFSYLVPKGPSRIVRFRYPGAAKIRSQTRDVRVRVRGSSTIGVDRKRVVNGEPVTFAGRLRGGFVPAGGKLAELQFFDRGKWRTFRTLRAAPSDGRWSYTYRFDGTRGTRTYRFRLRIPRENGYPFSTGRSRRVAVTVRGL